MIFKLVCLALVVWGLYVMLPSGRMWRHLRTETDLQRRANAHLALIGDAVRGLCLIVATLAIFIIFQ